MANALLSVSLEKKEVVSMQKLEFMYTKNKNRAVKIGEFGHFGRFWVI